MAFNLFRVSIISIFFFQNGKLVLRGSLFSGGSLLLGFANTCDILSLLLEVHYC